MRPDQGQGAARRFGGGGQLRRARRTAAKQILRTRCAGLLHFFKINDKIGSHCTIWLTPEFRCEWWPGRARLRLPDGRDVRAEPAHLPDILRELADQSAALQIMPERAD